MDITDLLAIVQAWDDLVRQHLDDTDHWYAHIHSDGTRFMPGQSANLIRRSRLCKESSQLCELARVPYKRPHALRHGHARYALERATTMAEVKSISQNLMHESIVVTDRVYGTVSAQETQRHIAGLGKTKNAEIDLSAFTQEIRNIMRSELAEANNHLMGTLYPKK